MPVGRRHSLRLEQRELSEAMRADGATWVQIAAVFQKKYRLNARTALRLAHGWSQPETARRWNDRWPDDTKTLKNISYWENWPNRTGREPSLPVLARLALLYQCSAADLIIDLADHSDRDPASIRQQPLWLECGACGAAVTR